MDTNTPPWYDIAELTPEQIEQLAEEEAAHWAYLVQTEQVATLEGDTP